MSYRRFYAPREAIQDDTIVFTGEESHHLARVVRLQAGDIIEVFDGTGAEYRCRVESVKPTATARVLEALPPRGESPLRITLVQSLTKFDKFDYIVQKATELGVAQIVPAVSGRTEVRWSEDRARRRVARWQKIALEAAKQCRRSRVPAVPPVVSFEHALKALAQTESVVKLCLAERGDLALKSALPAVPPDAIIIAVGPEGGWSDADLEMAAAHGYGPVVLGPRILRTETAALVALSILQYQFGDLGR